MPVRERLCWIHPDGQPEFWGTDYVGLRNEHDQVIPICRPCADQVNEPERVRDGAEITVGWPS